jgi:hypothetical protein
LPRPTTARPCSTPRTGRPRHRREGPVQRAGHDLEAVQGRLCRPDRRLRLRREHADPGAHPRRGQRPTRPTPAPRRWRRTAPVCLDHRRDRHRHAQEGRCHHHRRRQPGSSGIQGGPGLCAAVRRHRGLCGRRRRFGHRISPSIRSLGGAKQNVRRQHHLGDVGDHHPRHRLDRRTAVAPVPEGSVRLRHGRSGHAEGRGLRAPRGDGRHLDAHRAPVRHQQRQAFPCRLDVLYGYKTLRPQLACRLHNN